MDVAGTEQVHIILGVSITSALSSENEIQLIKPALLYADKVTLCSPATSMISMTAVYGTDVIRVGSSVRRFSN